MFVQGFVVETSVQCKLYGPVPVELAIIVTIKEVHFGAGSAHVRVNAKELEKGARSALLHADDDGLR